MVTWEWLKNKNVVVYGTGINAVKCVNLLEKHGIKVAFVLDGKEGIGRFKNYPVYKPIVDKLKKYYVVVASAYVTYPIIKEKLSGLREFENYVYYGWLDKKIVLLHGNCHMDVIEGFLNSSEQFSRNYAIYPTARVCTKEKIQEDILQYMDVWIHEDIRKNNALGYEFSDEYVETYLPSGIKEIIMPHLYSLGAGFFPHAKQENNKNTPLLNGAYENGMFPFKDSIIEEGVKRHMNAEEIYEYAMRDGIMPGEYIADNFDKYIKKIGQRESAWDIKILWFILDNYKKEKLFYDMGHPTNVVLKQIALKILEHLGIFGDHIETDVVLDYHEVPIYPWIRKVLGLEWDEDYIRNSNGAIKSSDTMDTAEYIREYLWWCHA